MRGVQASAGQDYSQGVMLAVIPPPAIAKAMLALLGDNADESGLPADELHVTVAYLGALDGADAPNGTPEQYLAAVASAGVQAPIHVALTHFDVLGDPAAPERAYSLVGSNAQLVAARERIVAALSAADLTWSNTYAYRPHLCLGYYTPDDAPVPEGGPLAAMEGGPAAPGPDGAAYEWDVSSIRLVWGTDIYDLDLAPAALVAVVDVDRVRRAMASPVGHEVPADSPAAVIPLRPVPFAYFDEAIASAKIKPGTKLKVDLYGAMPGHVYGVVAPYGVCIRDSQPGCWVSEDLRRADPVLAIGKPHQGDTLVVDPDGSERVLATANIGGGAGHSPDTPQTSTSEVQSYYENTSTQLMRVRYWWGEHGLCATGILWPDVAADPRAVATIEASPVSLHARPIEDEGGRLGFVGAALVNTPGLPLRRASAESIAGEGVNIIWDGTNVWYERPAARASLSLDGRPVRHWDMSPSPA